MFGEASISLSFLLVSMTKLLFQCITLISQGAESKGSHGEELLAEGVLE